MNDLIKNKAIEFQDNTIEAIQRLVRIDSVRDTNNAKPGAPFGPGINDALDEFLAMAKEVGMRTFKNPDGYYGYAEIGPEGTEMLGIIGHVDVVPVNDLAQWTKGMPFSGDIVDNQIVGRGTLDDKGPVAVNLMAIKLLLDLGYEFQKRVRIVVGCAEETTWECITEYNRLEEMPSMSYSPDANFPLINAEKTIHQFDVICEGVDNNFTIESNGAYNAVADSAVYTGPDAKIIAKELEKHSFEYELTESGLKVIGKSAHAMACHKGVNAITRLCMAMYDANINSPSVDFIAKFVKENHHAELIQGELIQEKVSGYLMHTIGMCKIGHTHEMFGCDTRIPVLADHEAIIQKYVDVISKNGLTYVAGKTQDKLYVPADDFLVATLLDVYKQVSGNMDVVPLSSGGGTYSRAVNNCVAFGMMFDSQVDTMHQPNEALDINVIVPALEIYANAIFKLLSK